MSIERILYKTPLQNEISNVYEIDEINVSTLNQVIQSRFASEGLYIIEQFSMPQYSERYLATPSFDKLPHVLIDKDWKFNHKEVEVYQLELQKQLFMPLDTNQFMDLFSAIANLNSVTVFTQVLLCKRQDNWKDEAIDAYLSYLNGNDSPIDNRYIRTIQNKALKVLNKISNYSTEREKIEEMEQKLFQNGYRFECRFVVFDDKHTGYFEREVTKKLNNLRLFNELELVKVSSKKSLIKSIENREFQSDLVNQILSESELFSVLCDSSAKESVTATINLPQPTTTTSITKSLENQSLLKKAIKILPYIENSNKEIDETKANQLNNALIRVGAVKKALKVNEIHQGASLQKIQLVIPPDITYSTIQKKLVDIQGAMGDEGITIEIGDKPDTINIYVPLEERDIVYFRQIFESEEFLEFKNNNPLPFIIGENANGGYMFGCLTQFRHLLIAGTTGSGKSVFETLILICLLLTVSPEMLSMYLIDPKMVELTMFQGFPQVKKIITDMNYAGELLISLCEEMDKRYVQFAKAKVKSIQGYNETKNEKMPYIVCAIDELADLMMVNSEVEACIVRLGQKARAAGIHLIIATQRPSVDVVTGLIKANMPNRISFSMTSQVDSRTVLDKGGAEKLLGRGDGLAKIEGSKKEFERFQSPILTLDSKEEEKVYEKLKELFKNVEANTVREEITPQKKEEPIDQIKRIIADTGETRLTELRKIMGIRMNVVQDLAHELVQQGWLAKENNKYTITASEEELNEFKTKESGAL